MKSLAPFLCVLALGCSAGKGGYTSPGVATVDFVPVASTDANLVLAMGDMHLSRIAIIGDAQQPPNGMPPPDIDLDLTGSGSTATLGGLEAGDYSVVLLEFHAVMLAGTWKGTPFTAHIEPVDTPKVHVNAQVGQDLGVGMNIAFTTDIDLGKWFSGDVLDGCMTEDGAIELDYQHNPMTADEIAMRIGQSFSIP